MSYKTGFSYSGVTNTDQLKRNNKTLVIARPRVHSGYTQVYYYGACFFTIALSVGTAIQISAIVFANTLPHIPLSMLGLEQNRHPHCRGRCGDIQPCRFPYRPASLIYSYTLLCERFDIFNKIKPIYYIKERAKLWYVIWPCAYILSQMVAIRNVGAIDTVCRLEPQRALNHRITTHHSFICYHRLYLLQLL